MNQPSVALTVVGVLVIVGLLVFAVVNDSGEAVLIAAGVAMSGVLAAVISSRRHRRPTKGSTEGRLEGLLAAANDGQSLGCRSGPVVLADPSPLRDADEFAAGWICPGCLKAWFTGARLGRHRAPGHGDRPSHHGGHQGRHDDNAPPGLPGELCGGWLRLHVEHSSLRAIGVCVRQQARSFGAMGNRGKPTEAKRR